MSHPITDHIVVNAGKAINLNDGRCCKLESLLIKICDDALFSGVVIAEMLAAMDAFVQINVRNGYEFDSNEPDVYTRICSAISKAKAAGYGN